MSTRQVTQFPGCAVLFMMCVAVSPATMAGQTVSYEALVHRLTDLEGLAVLPLAGEKGAMWSSYDRRSRYDSPSGKYVDWSANGDSGIRLHPSHPNHVPDQLFHPLEDDAIVMAEMEGPGVIWRIWSAQADQGQVAIYLDGQAEPTIAMPFAHYFDGQHEPFTYPSLVYHASGGHNLYVPIPYQKSCKVVAQKNWGRFFEFTYATFPKGTIVPTFSLPLSVPAKAALAQVDAFLRNEVGTDPAGRRQEQESLKKTVVAPAGQITEIARLAGPRAVTALKVTAAFRNRAEEIAALRKLVLQVTWDGKDRPDVWCPLGDFFGTAPGVNLYRSLPLGMTRDGFYSYWYMPFGKSAVLEVNNEDEATHELTFEVVHAPLARSFSQMGHFHAKWHRDLPPVSADRWPDWTVLQARGPGRFCGMMLHAWTNHGEHWWGEGDEKFFVDGETFPSTFGTGTEDYFGYAWCNPTLFNRPFHNQTMHTQVRGHQSVNRFQLADHVPFQRSFEGYLEKYFPIRCACGYTYDVDKETGRIEPMGSGKMRKCLRCGKEFIPEVASSGDMLDVEYRDRTTFYAATVYFYLAPEISDPIKPTPAAQRHGYYDVAPAQGAQR